MIITVGLDEVEALITYALFSAYVKDVKPLSLMIIAKVESGKTQTVEQFIENKGVLVLTDLTYYGLINKYKDEILSGQVKHIIIPDMIVPINRNRDTVNSLIAFLNAFIEEGVKEIISYAFPEGLNLPHPIRGGIITTVARTDFDRWKTRWAAVGFTSRFLPISYDYSPDTQKKIFEALIFRRQTSKLINLDLPDSPQYIHMSPGFATMAMRLSTAIGRAIDTYGFRAQRHLQTLMMSRALAEGRDSVKQEDFDMIADLTDYFYPSIDPDTNLARKVI